VRIKIFVDTLFIVALNLAEQYENYPLITTDAIFLESGNKLSANYRNEVVELIEQFLSSDEIDVIRLTPELFDQSLRLYKKHQDKSWGLVDCFSFVVMKQHKVSQALTFDRHFIQAGFQALMK
jgi:predicted nucleic acid-binding protein